MSLPVLRSDLRQLTVHRSIDLLNIALLPTSMWPLIRTTPLSEARIDGEQNFAPTLTSASYEQDINAEPGCSSSSSERGLTILQSVGHSDPAYMVHSGASPFSPSMLDVAMPSPDFNRRSCAEAERRGCYDGAQLAAVIGGSPQGHVSSLHSQSHEFQVGPCK